MELIGWTLTDRLIELSQSVGWNVPGSACIVVAVHLDYTFMHKFVKLASRNVDLLKTVPIGPLKTFRN